MSRTKGKRKPWRYDAIVKSETGKHRVFYAATRPVIGDSCPGIASPNKIVGFKRYKA